MEKDQKSIRDKYMEKGNESLPTTKKLRSDKLVDATKLEGEKNEEVFEITRRIERELSQFPEFIGVFPFGSSTRGYNSKKKESDFDMFVLFYPTSTYGLIGTCLDNLKLEYEKRGLKLQIISRNFNIQKFLEELSSPDLPSRENMMLSIKSIANLCRAGRGEKINIARLEVRNEILKMPKEKQEIAFQKIFHWLMVMEEGSLSKIKERIPDFNQEEYLDARRKLWEHRVHVIFGE